MGVDKAITVRGLSLLSCSIAIAGVLGCAAPESIEMDSFDPAQDQIAIAGYYRSQAVAMRQKAAAQAVAAVRYEELLGPDADAVSGARLLARYYQQTAQELERVADAHASAARTRQRPTVVR